MKLDSPLFDCIRVKPGEDRRLRVEQPCCDWPNCTRQATHRAPKGRNREREYWRYCLDHVREYNQSYNFFAGMSDDAVARYQKDAITGHLPTWKIGMIGGKGRAKTSQRRPLAEGADDPFDILRELGSVPPHAGTERRAMSNPTRKALHALGLEEGAGGPEIKARFKELVKRHHPDANGGDRASEDRLRAIIEAYNYLKKMGFC
jgi:hypothetical protein